MIRAVEALEYRAARTKSLVLSDSTIARTCRARAPHVRIDSTMEIPK